MFNLSELVSSAVKLKLMLPSLQKIISSAIILLKSLIHFNISIREQFDLKMNLHLLM